jgi:tetratricopeptide (TPR) repeat protein
VGRRLVLAAVLAVAAWPSARADWQVHRDGSAALLERGERALRENPDDEALARRVVQLAGRRGAAALRARFRARAFPAAQYAALAAYAQLLLALGDAPEAAAVFAEALKIAPDSVAARTGRARALALTGAVAEALGAYDQALERERRPAARRRLIEAELALDAGQAGGGDLSRRIALRRELVRLAPDSDTEAGRLADLLEGAGRPREAAEALEARLPADHAPTNPALALRAARLRLADRDPADADRAAADVAALIRRLPRGADEDRRAAWSCARDLARGRGSLGALGEQLERASGPVEWEMLGQVRDELGDLEGALAATRTALDRRPRDAAIGRRLIALLERLGRDEDATATAAELTRRIPDEVGFSTDLAERQLRAGDRAAAGATLDRAAIHFARQPAALQALAESAARAGDNGQALAIWRRLRRLDPTSELAIVGLGEAQFQSGAKNEARRTWSALRTRADSAAAGHLRLAEVLYDHDLFADAIDEAGRAQTPDGQSAAPHRLVARIYERQRRPDAALDEWNRVLTIAGRANGAGGDSGLRREARTHMLTLLGHQGRGRLDAEVQRLRADAQAHPDDLERALFLAEAQQRLGDGVGASDTLRGILGRASVAGAPNPAATASAVEAGFALARLLKRTGQLEEASARLEELGRLAPGRAGEVRLQIAGIALERYDVAGALAQAALAKAGADPATWARIAEIEERAGADALATQSYRKALEGDPSGAAALSLARIQVRQGDGAAGATTIETLLRTSHDDASAADAARRAVTLEEALGRLPELAEALSSPVSDGPESPARRKALMVVVKRLLPALYRDPASDDARIRLGRRWLRPLLELVTDADQPPDVSAITLLGMLGNADAAPALARIAARGAAPAANPQSHAARALNVSPEAELAALVALGRLGDPRGRSALEHAMASGGVSARTAAAWGLGRISDARATPGKGPSEGPWDPPRAHLAGQSPCSLTRVLRRALEDRRPEIEALACIGLGNQVHDDRDDRTLTLLGNLAKDPARPSIVRRAAIAALGRAGLAAATPTLIDLLDAGDADLSRAAAFALARGRDARALPALLTRALLPRRFALADADAPIAALGVWLAGAPPPDEARFVTGNDFDLGEALATFTQAPPPTDLSGLWRAHTRLLQDLLGEALDQGGDLRGEALAALDMRGDGPGLGALAPERDTSADLAFALREIALPLADRVAALLDDPEVAVRAAALRILAKLEDGRVSPARVAEAVRDGSAALAGAARVAAHRLARARPPLGPPLALAVAPLLSEEGAPASWRQRFAAVEVLAELGAPGRPYLERAAADRHAVVRQAALEALGRSDGIR